MEIGRREWLKLMGAVAVGPALADFAPALGDSREGHSMYGLITKLTAVPGKRDEMIAILKEGAAEMPGCLGYIIARDSNDENGIWITEVWESITKHHASLELPAVRNAMLRGKALIATFNRVAATEPVWSAEELTRR